MASDFITACRQDADDVFLNSEEYAIYREFSTRDRNGTYNIRNLKVIWNHDTLRNMSPVMMYGQLMVCDILLLTKIRDWPVRPRRNEVIWSPKDLAWTVLVCLDIPTHGLYRMGLQQVVASA